MSAETHAHHHTHNSNDSVPCPDPSVHAKSNFLSEQASTAALYVTKQRPNSRDNALDSNGKLSSKSAATSLKYAKAQDLPSFPSAGADSNTANAAAMLAKDHKMKELWQPEMSMAGSKAAAKAQKDGGKVDLWHPSASPAEYSAATLAMRTKGLSPQIDRNITDANRTNSLLAATKSVSQGRKRSDSTPVAPPASFPDSHNSNRNALNAATVSHRSSVRATQRPAAEGWNSEANQAARIQNVGSNMGNDMFGDHPIIGPEAEEQKKQAALRASAVSMAKKLYEQQNRPATPSDMSSSADRAGAETAHRRNQSSISTQPDLKEEAMKYIHLQDAAHKLAQERLAKVEKDMEPGKYREYYGYSSGSQRKSRLSVRGRGRKRASSEGRYFEDSSDDEEQARRIRTQMSQLSSASNTVDDNQRQEDRRKLLAAAERRVHARMHDMDEKVFQETGKVSQSMMDEWELKAREKAEKDRAMREQHPGKTHIGGGKYMDQADIDAIAAARLKPTLDEINDTAEKKRARDEEIAKKRDEQETARMEEKMKEQETKAEFKRIKEQDKAAAKKEKEERKKAERAEKEEAKARKSEDKRKSREQKREEVAAVAGGAALAEVAENVKTDDEAEAEAEVPTEKSQEESKAQPAEESKAQPPEETKEKTGGRSMFDRAVSKLKRNKRKSYVDPDTTEKDADRSLEPTDKPSTDEKVDQPDDGVAAPILPAVGAGIAASGGPEEEQDPKSEEKAAAPDEGSALPVVPNVSDGLAASINNDRSLEKDTAKSVDQEPAKTVDEDGDDRDPAKGAIALAGAAAVGAGIASAVAFDRTGRRDEDETAESPQSSDYSTDQDDDRDSLHNVTTSPEHDGSYNFAAPSPGVERKKPDLERHISTIQDSSSESDELEDSDDENEDDYFVQKRRPADKDTQAPLAEEENFLGAPAVEVPAVSPMPVGERPVDDAGKERDSPVSPLQEEEQDKILIVNKDAEPTDPHVDVTPKAATPEPAAPAPAVKTGPSNDEPAEARSESERKGVRGFFRKLKDRHRGEKKLQKGKSSVTSGESSEKGDEKSFQGGAKLTDPKTKEDTITPVTTTSAGKKEEEGLASEHVGTDGAIGDDKHISGVGGDPARATSPSSFKRHEKDLDDLDDASSSGADEDDVARGRGGRLAKKLGINTGKDETLDKQESKQSGVSGEDEQFEEARDQFDESLAPPPAFAGQAKSESPSRGTRFHEDL